MTARSTRELARLKTIGLTVFVALTATAACESSGEGGGSSVGARGGTAGALGGAPGAGASVTAGRGAQAGSSGQSNSAGTTSAATSGGSSADDAGAGGEPGSGGSTGGAGGNPAGDGGAADSSSAGAAGLGGRSAGAGGRGSAGASGGALAAGGATGGQLGAAGTTAGGAGTAGASSGGAGAGATGVIDYVFVITMENHDPAEIVGNTDDAPYINTLLASYAQGSNFQDQFSLSVPSEPHYIWMEAGTNEFSDHTFSNNDSPSASHSTSDTNHLVAQLGTAGVSWMSYQEDIDETSGACPIASSGHYHPRHNPFVFFQDVAGDPPSKTNSFCAAHHKSFDSLAGDLGDEGVARYNFITPNLCNDMHGHTGCPSSNLIRMGDDWLAAHMPGLIDFVTDHAGVVFIVWDEGDATRSMPFIAVGPGVKAAYTGDDEYTHGSLVKSLELIFDVPVSSRVSSENDFSDLFKPGFFP